jgi:FkbM family methyltransferase
MIDLTLDQQANPLLWKCVVGPLRGLRILQRRLGVRELGCTYFGADFLADLRDDFGFDLATRRFEHNDIARFVAACRRLRPGLFIDVGANMGIYSCIVGRLDAAIRIIAIEPDPQTFRMLERQIMHNRLASRATLIEAAAGASHGGEVGLVRVDGNRGMIKVSDRTNGYCAARVVALDALDLPHDSCVAIKIDVEGFEPEVLRGGRDFFRRNHGYAQIEAIGDALAPLAEQMAAAGWAMVDRYGINAMFEKH